MAQLENAWASGEHELFAAMLNDMQASAPELMDISKESPETLNLYGYISAFTNFDISYSLTIAMVLTIFTNVALLLLYNLAFKAQARGAV